MLESNKFENEFDFSQKLITLLNAFTKVGKRDIGIKIQAQVCTELVKQIIEYDEIFQYVGEEQVKLYEEQQKEQHKLLED